MEPNFVQNTFVQAVVQDKRTNKILRISTINETAYKKMQDEKVMELANTLNEKLTKAGIRCEVDDSDKSPGFKFNEAEVKGIPLRIEFGPRDLENNQIIVAKRNDYTKQTIELNSNIEEVISKLLDQIQDEMYNKALEHLNDNTHETKDYNELKNILETNGGFVKVPWCKELDCELKIKEDINATSRCIVGENTKDKCICCGKDSKCDVYFISVSSFTSRLYA